MSKKVKISVQRGNPDEGFRMEKYEVEVEPGMVVLDAVHLAQAQQAHDLSVRWNCKAGKCGSCSAEINGKPKLMCMTRLSDYPEGDTIEIRPLRTFPVISDLVTDVSWNFEVNKHIKPYTNPEEGSDLLDPETGEPVFLQHQADRVQEFRKCIECFLCQDVCHVLRTHDKKGDFSEWENNPKKFENFSGPRFMVRLASLEMHPTDTEDSRLRDTKDMHGIGYCNITRCCTEVCPENITITDNAIIPMKERVISQFYDPVTKALRFLKILK